MICIRRRFEDVVVEPEWENWERLSYRQLRRQSTPARCNLTIFARPRYNSWPETSEGAVNEHPNATSETKAIPTKRAGDGSPNLSEAMHQLKRSRSSPHAAEIVPSEITPGRSSAKDETPVDRVVVDFDMPETWTKVFRTEQGRTAMAPQIASEHGPSWPTKAGIYV